MAFQLFVDPTAGARQASDHIMSAAGDIADRIKEERQKEKDETKLFKAKVTEAAAMKLGQGDTMSEREAYLSKNYTPDTIGGLILGNVTRTSQDHKKAAIDATVANTKATEEATDYQRKTSSLRMGILSGQAAEMGSKLRLNESQIQSLNLSNEQKQNLLKYQDENLKLGIEAQKEQIKSSRTSRKATKQATQQASEMFGINKKKAKQQVKLINEQIASAVKNREVTDRQIAVMEQNAVAAVGNAEASKIRAGVAASEERRLTRLSEISAGEITPAHLSDGTLIPGMYIQPHTKKVIEIDSVTNMDPARTELARLEGALLQLDGTPDLPKTDPNYLPPRRDEDLIDVDQTSDGFAFGDLGPIGWFESWYSAKDDTVENVKRRIRAKIAEQKALLGPTGKALRYDQKTGKLVR